MKDKNATKQQIYETMKQLLDATKSKGEQILTVLAISSPNTPYLVSMVIFFIFAKIFLSAVVNKSALIIHLNFTTKILCIAKDALLIQNSIL